MNSFQSIYDIAELCYLKGVRQAVLCPGSRCAPLTIAFARHKGISTQTFSDERSAAFIALGMAQEKKIPVALICTSGTAAYNFAPAVTEAFFSEIPLIVFTADRPSEWVGQQDGQAIYQQNIFGKHVRGFFELPQEYTHADDQWAVNRIINDAINMATGILTGPVQINAPFREPFYPSKEQPFEFSNDLRVISRHTSAFTLKPKTLDQLRKQWTSSKKILVVAGQGSTDENVVESINLFTSTFKIPVLADITANLHACTDIISNTDLLLATADAKTKAALQPDLLITFGGAALSKSLKQFLRQFAPTHHWHISNSGHATDTFQHLTDVLSLTPVDFFEAAQSFPQIKESGYFDMWSDIDYGINQVVRDHVETSGDELSAVATVMKDLPDSCTLHLANSMSVRYANFIGLDQSKKNINVCSNRGTSGIDGCVSTAMGHALLSEHTQVLITGDLAFFYDRNAFWHNYKYDNLKIVVLNNHGGIIFGLIDGPGDLPERDEYFITHQALNTKKICEEFGIKRYSANKPDDLTKILSEFFNEKGAAILEIETLAEGNIKDFEKLKQKIKQLP